MSAVMSGYLVPNQYNRVLANVIVYALCSDIADAPSVWSMNRSALKECVVPEQGHTKVWNHLERFEQSNAVHNYEPLWERG